MQETSLSLTTVVPLLGLGALVLAAASPLQLLSLGAAGAATVAVRMLQS